MLGKINGTLTRLVVKRSALNLKFAVTNASGRAITMANAVLTRDCQVVNQTTLRIVSVRRRFNDSNLSDETKMLKVGRTTKVIMAIIGTSASQ
jgi:hypothetical protein